MHILYQLTYIHRVKNIKYELEEARVCIKKLRKIFDCPMPIMWGNAILEYKDLLKDQRYESFKGHQYNTRH